MRGAGIFLFGKYLSIIIICLKMDQRSNAGECIKSLLLFTTESQNDKGRIQVVSPGQNPKTRKVNKSQLCVLR